MDVVELQMFTGKARDLDVQNSGKYVIGRLERQFTTSRDQMTTKLTISLTVQNNVRSNR